MNVIEKFTLIPAAPVAPWSPAAPAAPYNELELHKKSRIKEKFPLTSKK